MAQHKIIAGIAGASALAGIVVLGGLALIGGKVNGEIDALRATLAERDDVQVHRLAYDKRLASGTLHYDVEFRPRQHDPLYALITGLTSETEAPAIRLSGDTEVRHGAFGNGMVFALAAAEEGIMLPESWQQHLPEFPARTPLVIITAKLALDGALHVEAEGSDYSGMLVGGKPDNHGRLDVSDWGGSAAINRHRDAITLDGRFGELSLDVEAEDLQIGFHDLTLHADGQEHLPKLWLGESSLRLGSAEIDSAGEGVSMRAIELLMEATAENGRVDQVITMNVGETAVDDYVYKGASLVTAVRGVDEQALQRLSELAERYNPGASTVDDAEIERALLAVLEQMLEHGLTASIDKLSLHLAEPDDFSAALSMSYPEAAAVDFSRPDSMLESATLNASFDTTSDALRVMMQMGAEMEARGVSKVSQAQIDSAAEAKYQETMQALAFMPFLNVDERGVRGNLEVSDGMIRVNGQPLMRVADLMRMM